MSRKWHTRTQGPEETQAGERYNNGPTSVTSAKRRFRLEVTIQRECFKQFEEQSSLYITLQSVGMEGKKVEAAGEGQVTCGGRCQPQKSRSWQVSRLITTPSLKGWALIPSCWSLSIGQQVKSRPEMYSFIDSCENIYTDQFSFFLLGNMLDQISSILTASSFLRHPVMGSISSLGLVRPGVSCVLLLKESQVL